MKYRRLARLGAIAAAAVALGACSQLQQTSVPTPRIANTIYDYTAVGASDAVGFGSSVPCATAAVVVGADTVQMPSPVSCPGGKGYVPVISRMLRTGLNVVNLTDLGISGAVIGPDIRAIGNQFEPVVFGGCTSSGATACVPGDFLSDELPVLPAQINNVTIFAGGNDTDAIFAQAAAIVAGGGDPTAAIQSDIAAFGNDYNVLIGTIHAEFPFARIYVANLPNFGLIPRGVCLGATTATPECPVPGDNPGGQQLLDVISTSIDADVINGPIAASGIPVLDLECDPESYAPANFYTDGFHPNDAGYAIFAKKLALVIQARTGPAPAGNCPPYSLSTMRHPLRGLISSHLSYIRY
jgi:lysophospholipase L1-like esterase